MKMPTGSRRRRRGWGSDSGSIVLEASMVFPWALLVTFLAILLSMRTFDRASAYFSAVSEAERAAFSWAHESADPGTGAYPSGSYDDLYWRLKDDALLAGLFGWGEGESRVSVPIGGGKGNDDASPAERKLVKAAARLAELAQGNVSYRNQIWRREITVETDKPGLPSLSASWGNIGNGGPLSVSAIVTEPAEFIRTFDLARMLRNRMREKGEGADEYRRQAGKALGGLR